MSKNLRSILLAITCVIISIALAIILIVYIINSLYHGHGPGGSDNIDILQSVIPATTSTTENPFTYADTNSRYFYSRIVIVGQNKNNQTLTIKLQFVRMQKAENLYGHSYYAYVTYNDVVKSKSSSFDNPETRIVANGFLKHAESTTTNTAEETYSFTMNIDDLAIDINLEDLNSDFIVKNSLNMTRYISAGVGKVKIGDQVYNVNAMVDNTYSYDISKQPNTSNTKDLKFTTHSIILWDEKNNFYLIDVSDVKTPNPLYESHKWLLYKNVTTGFVKKSSNCILTMYTSDGLPDRWTIEIPDINKTKLELKAVNTYGDKLRGDITGTVTDTEGKRNINGNFVYINN